MSGSSRGCSSPIDVYFDPYTYIQFAAQVPFYKLADKIIDSTQSNLSPSGTTTLFKYLSTNNEGLTSIKTSTVMNNSMKQVGPAIMIGISAALCFATFIFAAGVTYRRCFSKWKNSDTRRFTITSKWALNIQLFFYLISFSLVLAMVMIYGLSVAEVVITLNEAATYQKYRPDEDENTQHNQNYSECVFRGDIVGNYRLVQRNITDEPFWNLDVWAAQTGIQALRDYQLSRLKWDLEASINSFQRLQDSLTSLMDEQDLMNDVKCAGQINDTVGLVNDLMTEQITMLNLMGNITQQKYNTLTNANATRQSAERNLTDSLNAFSAMVDLSSTKLHTMSNSLNNPISVSNQWTKQLNKKFDSAASLALEWKGLSPVSSVAKAVIAIPTSFILLFMLIGMVVTFAFVFKPHLIDTRYQNKARYTGRFLMIGFYISVYSSWIVMLVTGTLYWFANPFSSTCYNMYDNVGLHHFYHMEQSFQVNATNFNGSNMSYNYGDFLTELQTSKTVFAALGRLNDPIKPLMTTQEVISFINDGYHVTDTTNTIQLMDLQTSFDDSTLDLYKQTADQLQKSTATYDSYAQIGFLGQCRYSDQAADVASALASERRELDTLSEEANQLTLILLQVNSNSQNTTDVMITQLQSFFNEVIVMLTNYTQQYENDLNEEVGVARDTYSMYETSSELLCYSLRGPINGAWAASGMLGLLMIPVAFLLLCTANRLKGIEQVREEHQERQPPPPYEERPQSLAIPTSMGEESLEVSELSPALVRAYQYERF